MNDLKRSLLSKGVDVGGYDLPFKHGGKLPSAPKKAKGRSLGQGSTLDFPGGKSAFKPVTAFSQGGSLNPRHNPMMPGSASFGLLGIPPGGIEPPILMYQTDDGINDAVTKALRRTLPLPRGEQGMKFANSQFGDKTVEPKSVNKPTRSYIK